MDAPSQQSQPDIKLRQYQALVEVAESIGAHRHLSSLLRDLKKRLHQIVRVDAAQVVLHDQTRNLMRRLAVHSPAPSGGPPITELSIEEAPAGWVWETQQALLINDPATYVSRYPRVVAELREYGIQTTYVLPLTSLGRRLGALVFMSREETAWSEEELALLRQVTKLVALAVDNVINSETARTSEIELNRRVEQLRLMLKITNEMASELDLQELLEIVCSTIREAIGNDIVDVSLFDHESGQLRAFVTDFPPDHPLGEKGYLIPLEGGPSGLAFTSGQPVFIDQPDPDRFNSALSLRVFEEGYRSGATIPLITQGRKLGVLGIISKLENAFSDDEKEFLIQVANQVAIAVDNALNFERARKAEQQANRNSERLQLLLEINNAVVSNLDLPGLMETTSTCLARVSQYDAVGLALYDPELNQLRPYTNPTDQAFVEEEEPIPLEGSAPGLAFTTGQPVLLDRYEGKPFRSDFNNRFRRCRFQVGRRGPAHRPRPQARHAWVCDSS